MSSTRDPDPNDAVSADPTVDEPTTEADPTVDEPGTDDPDGARSPAEGAVLMLSVFVVASCGIAYELVIGATGAYIAGDGVTQFSLTIGVFLFGMGLGSFLSRQVKTNLLATFISVELVVGLVGGFANTILFMVYAYMTGYEVVFYSLLVFVGTMIGLEIPLLIRLLAQYGPLRINVANVLGLDYIGALGVAIAFPLVLLPALGLMRTSLLFGILNVSVGIGNLVFFRKRKLPKALWAGALICLVALVGAFAGVETLIRKGEAEQYDDEIILTKQTKYQRIVLTRWREEIRLFIDRNIQFSSRDEYRYHEGLVHPLLSTLPSRERILILGGGDGLGLREVLKYDDVKSVTLVDLDEGMVDLCRTNKHISKLNKNSLSSPKVKLVYRDAWSFLMEGKAGLFDAIIVDMPDPVNEKVAKLYSRGFYKLVNQHLGRLGGVVVQSTSPYFAPKAFWSIHNTIKAAGFEVTPIHVHVPTFGPWGFNLASRARLPWAQSRVRVPTKYLNNQMWPAIFAWPNDQPALDAEITTLDKPMAIFYYQEGYKQFFKSRSGDAAPKRRR